MNNPTPTITVARKCEVVVPVSGLEDHLAEILRSLRMHGDHRSLATCLATLIVGSMDHGSVSISGFTAEWRWDEDRHMVVEMEVESRESGEPTPRRAEEEKTESAEFLTALEDRYGVDPGRVISVTHDDSDATLWWVKLKPSGEASDTDIRQTGAEAHGEKRAPPVGAEEIRRRGSNPTKTTNPMMINKSDVWQ